MERIAIYGEVLKEKHYDFIRDFFDLLENHSFTYYVYDKYKDQLSDIVKFNGNSNVFHSADELIKKNVECLISIGGDGTMLNSFQFILKTDIYVFGFNTGRLGFLSNVSTEKLEWAFEELASNNFSSKNRTVLEIDYTGSNSLLYAVNELTIHKQDTSSMLTIHAKIDEDYINSYWADGLIVTTPTGSTAYSLSCGGPILMPGSDNFMITPISPHNLTVRPIVYNNNKAVSFRVESRSDKFLLSMDSSFITLSTDQEVFVKKASFSIRLLKFSDYNYFNTLRSKLMWGADKRN